MNQPEELRKTLTVRMAPSTLRILESLAADEGVDRGEALRRAIAVKKWIHDTRKQGGHILVNDKGTTRELVPRSGRPGQGDV